MQSTRDATRLATAGYPGGLVALCARFGWNYETTRKEVAGAAGFKLDADKLLHISQICMEAGGENCTAIDDAWKAAHEHIGSRAKAETASMGQRVSSALKEVSDVVTAHEEAMRDGNYSANDVKRVTRETLEAIGKLAQVLDGAVAEGAKVPLKRAA